MSKVKITQEQADLIEQFKRNFKGFGREVLIETLDGHYEIKLKFKTGDIVNDGYSVIREVSAVEDGGIMLYTNYKKTSREWYGNETDDYKRIRHATDVEVELYKKCKLWYENGREVGEFRLNDIIFNKNLGGLDEIMTGFTKVNYTDEYEIVCFAHNREDLKND